MLLSLRAAIRRDSDEHSEAEVMLRGWVIKGSVASPLFFLLITQLAGSCSSPQQLSITREYQSAYC